MEHEYTTKIYNKTLSRVVFAQYPYYIISNIQYNPVSYQHNKIMIIINVFNSIFILN